MSRRVLVIGASRGIGLGLVDRHLADAWEVHATTRDGIAPRTRSRLTTHRLDVRDVDQSTSLVAVQEHPLDRVIHNAGINRGGRAESRAVRSADPSRPRPVPHLGRAGASMVRPRTLMRLGSTRGCRSQTAREDEP
ncbi:MAG TPA: NAD-dependent epimerase/dehydratase family protein [Acidimicrobiia bacterium]